MEKLSSGLPLKCIGCKKTGMEAIRCPIFPVLENETARRVQCRNAHGSEEVKNRSGAVYVSSVNHFNSPKEPSAVVISRGRNAPKRGWRKMREKQV